MRANPWGYIHPFGVVYPFCKYQGDIMSQSLKTEKTTMRLKRYVTLSLGFIERKFDASGNKYADLFVEAALAHIKIRNVPSAEEEKRVKEILTAVLEHADETASELDEFNVSLSGVCDTCGEVILYGQDGFTDHHESDFCCTPCYIEELIAKGELEKVCTTMSFLTDYGKIRVSNRLKHSATRGQQCPPK